MITHKATISSLANEMLSVIGFSFSQIYTQSKGVLILELVNGDSVYFIEFSTNSPYDRILLLDKYSRAKANTKDLFGVLIGEIITNISQVNDDRILAISTANHILYFKLFGHNHSDVVITTKKDKIIHSLNNLELIGTNFHIDTNVQKDVLDFDYDTFFSEIMKKSKYYFGKYYTDQYIADNNISKKSILKDFNKYELSDNLENFYFKLAKSTKSYVYKIDESKYLFSLIELDGYELYKKCDSISEGIKTKFISEISKAQTIDLKKKAFSKLDKLIGKDSKSIEEIKKLDDGSADSEKYKHFAELLISQPNPRLKVGKQIELQDWDGDNILIPLDEKLNLIDNSHKYFKKSSSILKDRAYSKSKLIELEKRLARNRDLREEIESIDNIKQLENLLFENRRVVGGLVEKKEAESKEDKFKKYELSENFILYVGKNAKNNDELTLRFAKPNDIWLHARGVGGSHCVIRVDGREPSKGIIKEAAAIAAYYSKAKTSHLAPVAYTQKKYVSKPKGANPGAVVVRREEVILVEPYKPE